MDQMHNLLKKIIKDKERHHLVEDTLIYKVIQTLEEYIADNLEPKNRYQKTKFNVRIEAYEDCINLLKELVNGK